MTKEYPKELISAFNKCKKSEWSDEFYAKFAEEAKKFLKGKADDKIEHSKLVVELARLSYKEKPSKKKTKEEALEWLKEEPDFGSSLVAATDLNPVSDTSNEQLTKCANK